MYLKPCANCGALCEYPKKYCKNCEILYQNGNFKTKSYRKMKEKHTKKFYSSKEWKILSKTKLAREPLCEICGKIATDVHHIKSIKTCWEQRLDYSNLQSLCVTCHNKQR